MISIYDRRTRYNQFVKLMLQKNILIILILALTIYGCASPDAMRKPIEVFKLEENKYQVYFRGTPLTTNEEALEIWHYKAKGVCQNSPYRYEIIQNEEKLIRRDEAVVDEDNLLKTLFLEKSIHDSHVIVVEGIVTCDSDS